MHQRPAHKTLVIAVRHFPEDWRVLDSTRTLDELQMLLDAGAPADLEPGMEAERAIDGLIQLARHSPSMLDKLLPHMQLLIGRGANPMLGTAFKRDTLDHDRQLSTTLVALMGRAEALGFSMRSAQGKTPLHVVMEHPHFGYHMAASDWKNLVDAAWIDTVPEDPGCTPLHSAWRKLEGAYARYQMRLDRGETPQKIDMDILWTRSLRLIQLGARLDIPNQHGQTMAQLISRYAMVMELTEEGEQVVATAQASLQHQALAANLPGNASEGKLRARL